MIEIYNHNPTAFWFNVVAMALLIILGVFAIYGVHKKEPNKKFRDYPSDVDEKDIYSK